MVNIYPHLAVYILILVVVSYIISRKQTKEDFLIGGRNRGTWQILASKFAAGIGAGFFITYAGFAYEFGSGVYTLLFGIAIGYLLFAYWASPKIHKGSKEKKFYTIGDFVYDKTKSNVAKNFANFISILIMFLWLTTGIIGGAKIVNDFGFLSYEFAVVLTSLVVLLYILIAGFRAVILTDFIQSLVILILLFVITFSILGSQTLDTIIASNSGNVNIGIALGFFLFGILSAFSNADRYQLCYAAIEKNKLKKGLGLAIIPIFLSGFLLLLVGVFMSSNYPGLDSGLIFTEALKNYIYPSLLPFAVVLFFAGVMSSADTNIFGISSHYALSKKISTKRVKLSTLLVVFLTTFVALLFPDVVDVSIVAGGMSLTSSFAMIYLLFNGESSSRFINSIIGGLMGLILGILYFGLVPIMALPVIILSSLGLLFKFGKNSTS